MKVLIVESEAALAKLWSQHLGRIGALTYIATDQDAAIDYLAENAPDVIIMDLVLDNGSALAVADFASYRRPETRVIFVTNTSFFSDGSIFSHVQNACAFVQTYTPPEDLVAMVEHYAAAS
ncbi:MAG: response regulator [Pseudomonadota bacterium]